MEALTAYKTVYTILFVFAAVFFVISVVLFFLLDIRTVFTSLHGRSALSVRIKKSSTTTGKTAKTANTAKTAQTAATAVMGSHPGTIMAEDGVGVGMTERFLETVNTIMMPDDEGSQDGMTEELPTSNGTPGNSAASLLFCPERKILVYSSKQRIS